MSDWRRLYDEGCCVYGCNACRTCMCALADDVIALNAELVAVLQAILDNEAIVYFVPSDAFAMELHGRARAAIAKTKGEE